jgi:hypothetical protein
MLGELIGRAVHDALTEALALQNGLTPVSRRSVVKRLQRFGATNDGLIEIATSHLDSTVGKLLSGNFVCIECDPLVVAAVTALVRVRDEVIWGILPTGCIPEYWSTYGAQIAAAVSGDYTRIADYREALTVPGYSAANEEFVRLVGHAIALGFSEKWTDRK